jgi:hypothetical protein
MLDAYKSMNYWGSYMIQVLSAFRTRGPSTGPTSEFCAVCPCPDGLMQDGTQEEG